MEAKKILLVKYGEISLRKGNRTLYERILMDTIRGRLKDVQGGNLHVLREQGRFLIEDPRGDIDENAVLPIIKPIFGIAGFCAGLKANTRELHDWQRIGHACLRPHIKGAGTFKVETKRSDKRYPLTSNEISAAVGGYILEKEPALKVDVHHPDKTLWLEIRNYVYFYVNTFNGEGGLPYGTSGKGMLLLSGGIDSPVAGYLMARRGVEIIPVYFHSPPFTSERALDKVKDLVRRLSVYTGKCKLYIVAFTDVQLFLHEHIQAEKLTLLLKRAMLQIADRLAKKEGCHCLVTGDSIGQVASQTMHSLAAVNTAASLPIFRPLSVMDKQQIIDIAMQIDTYDISIRPYEDCCTLFVAKHPENKPKASVIEKIEERLEELPPLLEEALEKTVIYELL